MSSVCWWLPKLHLWSDSPHYPATSLLSQTPDIQAGLLLFCPEPLHHFSKSILVLVTETLEASLAPFFLSCPVSLIQQAILQSISRIQLPLVTCSGGHWSMSPASHLNSAVAPSLVTLLLPLPLEATIHIAAQSLILFLNVFICI